MRDAWSVADFAGLQEKRAGGEPYGLYDLSEALGLRQMRANAFRFRPGDRMEYHNHDWQEELLLVLEGEMTLVVEGDRHAVRAGDVMRFAPQPRRQVVNESDADCLWLAFGAPPIDDDWNEFEEGTPGDPPAPDGSWALARSGELDEKARDRYVITWLTEPLGLVQLRGNLFRFRPGDNMYLHSHTAQEEVFYVLSGAAEMTVGDETRLVGPGDAIRVDREPPRRLVHAGEAECVWLAVGAPPVDDDAVFLE